MFDPDDDLLSKAGTVRTLLDPTCGTGGMLAEAQKYLFENHSKAELFVFGQDFNPRAYAIAASDMLIKGHEKNKIEFGDSLTDDKFAEEKFSYFLANPPFGVDWKKQQKEVTREHEKLGFAGRFGAGLPRVNDGSLLFLQHMIDKFEPVRPREQQYGSRLAIVFNGSPLFTGPAGSGESNIRKWIIESDWLEAVVALPEQMFYNTGIGTYVWLVTNRKQRERKGKIQLIDARARWKPMRRSMGDKRRYLGDDDIGSIVREYGAFVETETSKIFDNIDFGYTRVTVERPLRLRFRMDTQHKSHFLDAYPHLLDDVQAIDAALGRADYFDWNVVWERAQDVLRGNDSRWRAPELRLFRSVFTERDPSATPVVVKRESVNRKHTLTEADRFGGWFPETFEVDREVTMPLGFSVRHQKDALRVRFEPDSELRDFENIPLKVNIDDYFRREVLPYVPDAWMDREKDKIGYEINFNRYFYRFVPPRSLDKIDADLKVAEKNILRLLREVTA
jgi:type I restriction enzyme M protein